MQKGRIILLNGAAAAGKTSISKVLQNILEEPYLHINIDAFLATVPPRYFGLDPAEDDLSRQGVSIYSATDDKGTYYRIQAGSYGYHLVYGGFHQSVLAMAAHGHNLILDDILLEKKFLLDYVRLLNDFEVWFIQVYCPLEVLEQREIARGDSLPGSSRGHFKDVYAYKTVDLTVDTSLISSEAAAEQIKTMVTSGRKPTAFEQLRASLLNDEGRR